MPFFQFWFTNFGIWLPIIAMFLGLSAWRLYQGAAKPKLELFAFLDAAQRSKDTGGRPMRLR